MLRYAIRRLLIAILTLLAISFVVFAVLDLAPGDPTAQLSLTIPPETRRLIRQSLGLGQPFPVRYVRWLEQLLANEPINLVEVLFGVEIGDSEGRLRVRSWATRSPVVDLITQRLPQNMTVVGVSYLVAILIAVRVRGVGGVGGGFPTTCTKRILNTVTPSFTCPWSMSSNAKNRHRQPSGTCSCIAHLPS